ncbi:MAG: phosphatidate cytidylyltransferase [Burkholderiales bacterium]
MLNARIRTALVALPLFLAALFFLPKAGWALFLMAWMVVGAWEWAALAKWSTVMRTSYALIVAGLSYSLWTWVVTPDYVHGAILLYGIALVFWFAIAPMWLALGWRVVHPLLIALTGLVLLLPLWLALVQLQAEPQILLILMIVIWISDTTAFLCGKRWGKRKLAPSISPGKTWEGVVGALAGVTLYYGIVSVLFPFGHTVLNGVIGLAVFLVLTVLGVEGDLFESWIKRTAGVKDSGTILPGHGGILDRVDALTSSMPVAALILVWSA